MIRLQHVCRSGDHKQWLQKYLKGDQGNYFRCNSKMTKRGTLPFQLGLPFKKIGILDLAVTNIEILKILSESGLAIISSSMAKRYIIVIILIFFITHLTGYLLPTELNNASSLIIQKKYTFFKVGYSAKNRIRMEYQHC